MSTYIKSTAVRDLSIQTAKITNKAVTQTKLADEVSNSISEKATTSYVNEKVTELNTRIDNVSALGRFLSTWDCSTGKPDTEPIFSPGTSAYTYHTGDYFIVGKVSGTTKYIPEGTQYLSGSTSTATTEEDIKINDLFRYDGTSWIWMPITAKEITIDSVVGLSDRLSGIDSTIVALSAGTEAAVSGLSNDIVALSGNVCTVIEENEEVTAQALIDLNARISGITTSLSGKVDSTRTIAGNALSSDISASTLATSLLSSLLASNITSNGTTRTLQQWIDRISAITTEE